MIKDSLKTFCLNYVRDKDIGVCQNYFFLNDSFDKQKSKIIVLTDDHLSNTHFFLPVDQRIPSIYEQIILKCNQYPNQEFIIIHNCIDLNIKSKNYHFVYWAPEWMSNHRNNYLNIAPQVEKNFSSDSFWISLNRNRRMHRYLTSMYLLGNGFEKFGMITLDPTEMLDHQSWETWLSWWEFNQRSDMITSVESFFPVLKNGFEKIKKGIGFTPIEYTELDPMFLSNDQNFDQRLRKFYSNTFVEIINETIWVPDTGGQISEKYLNSVYGFNFPIIVGVQNSVRYLRNLGLDLFDDVVDHSYDQLINPTQRLITALENNKNLLCQKHTVQQAWMHCQKRMMENVRIVKDLEKDTLNIFENVIKSVL